MVLAPAMPRGMRNGSMQDGAIGYAGHAERKRVNVQPNSAWLTSETTACSLTLETVPKHKDCKLPKYANYAAAFRRVGLQALEETEKLKSEINEKAKQAAAIRAAHAQQRQVDGAPASRKEDPPRSALPKQQNPSESAGVDFDALMQAQSTPHSVLHPGLVSMPRNSSQDQGEIVDSGTTSMAQYGGMDTENLARTVESGEEQTGQYGIMQVEESGYPPVSEVDTRNTNSYEENARWQVPPDGVPGPQVGQYPYHVQVGRPVVVRHVPRPNKAFPSEDLAKTDYERLRQRLELYGLQEKVVRGDGNCQFRAISDQLYGDPERHKEVREQVILQLRNNEALYRDYVADDDGGFEAYLNRMAQDGAWGDHITLQAAADVYCVRFSIISSYPGDEFLIKIEPNGQESSPIYWLSFWAEVHYNSLYPNYK